MSLTCHFIHSNVLISLCLSVNQFDERVTADNIRKCIETIWSEFGLSVIIILKCCYFVIDNGSNIKAAFAICNKLPCACHKIATAVRHTLFASFSVSNSSAMLTFEEKVISKDITRTISNVKNLFTYFKKSGLKKQLKVTLKQSK